MTWLDIEDVIFDGSKREVEKLKCPECNGKVYVNYDAEIGHIEYGCKKCGISTYMNGCDVPMFAKTSIA